MWVDDDDSQMIKKRDKNEKNGLLQKYELDIVWQRQKCQLTRIQCTGRLLTAEEEAGEISRISDHSY